MCAYQTTVILNGNKITAVILCKTVMKHSFSSYVVFHVSKDLTSYCWPAMGHSISLIYSDAVPLMGRDSAQTLYLFRLQKRALRIVLHRCQSISVLHIIFYE